MTGNSPNKLRIYYGRYSDKPDVAVRFESKGTGPEQYSLGWFRNLKKIVAGEMTTIFNKEESHMSKVDAIFLLLEFLEEYFDDVTDTAFCKSTEVIIQEKIRVALGQ